jgi:thiol:disulfide interchange protein DsbC
LRALLLATLLAAISSSAIANADPETAAVFAALKAKYPKTPVTAVERTPIAGIYEIAFGKTIAYTDASGRYFLFGNVFDMQTQSDLTAPKRESLNRVAFKELPLDDAVTIVKGNGSRHMALFTDPDCPYCKRLEAELLKLDNVTIHMYLFPLAQLHPDAKAKAEAVWCAPDQAKAWRDLMLSGKLPSVKPCDTPVDRNLALAGRMGIQGTPYMIAADGRTLPGAAPVDQINAWLNGAK